MSLLRAVDEGVQRFAQRREPQPEIHELGIFQRDLLLEVRQVAVQAQRFEFCDAPPSAAFRREFRSSRAT